MLNGKKVIFVGDSNVYWGRCVDPKPRTMLTQKERENDHGSFYQICKANGMEPNVTNWTFGRHRLGNIFGGECTVKAECQGVNHQNYITDPYYDYVFICPSARAGGEKHVKEDIQAVMDFFKKGNPNVQFIIICCASIYGINDDGTYRHGTIDYIKELSDNGVTVANWGKVVYDILNGNCEVPYAINEYIKSTFVINDDKHPNLLAGYIASLTAFCVLTGKSAIGQTYDYFYDKDLKDIFDIPTYIDAYYDDIYTTNFDKVFESKSDMLGLQMLIDKYISEKKF